MGIFFHELNNSQNKKPNRERLLGLGMLDLYTIKKFV